ncbi:MAG: glycosyltransferase family 4 protein [Alicyclobacillus sp.]|nr:glycosyltransferase family 4 protein [Alicyclobacillus sp.]
MRLVTSVAVVAPEDLPIPPVRGGSVQIYLHHLCRCLGQLGDIEAVLVSPGDQPDPQLLRHIPVRLRWAPGERRRSAYRAAVLRLLESLSPQVVQVDNRPDFVPLVRTACPAAKVVLNLHSLTFLGPAHLSSACARRILRDCDAVVCNSRFLRNTVQTRFRLRDQEWRPSVIYPGVDHAQFAPPGDLSAVEVHPDRPLRILYVGRIIRGKGVDVLLEAVRLLRKEGWPVSLTLVGRTPPWEAEFGRYIRRRSKGLPVHRAGFVPPQHLPEYYRQADVLVCPSQAPEAFGLVNLEALAAGLPVVASRQGGIEEVVTAECGVLVRHYRDPAGFAAALRTLADNPSLRARLRQGALLRARQFTWTATAEAFADLHRSL